MGFEDDLLDLDAEVGELARDLVGAGARRLGQSAHAGPEALADETLVGAHVVRGAEGLAAGGGLGAGGVDAAQDVVGPLAGDVVEAVEVGGVADALRERGWRAGCRCHGLRLGRHYTDRRGAAPGAGCRYRALPV